MKKIFGRHYKNFIFIILFFAFMQNTTQAYETVLVEFPNAGWHKVFYQKRDHQVIGQYLPSGQSRDNYIESMVFHSYKGEKNRRLTALYMLEYHIGQAMYRYNDMQLTYIKNDSNDAIAIWCSERASQCEIVRSTQGFEGIITMHYINKNPQYFQNICSQWLNIVRGIKLYYSYYRWDVIMNKANTVEL